MYLQASLCVHYRLEPILRFRNHSAGQAPCLAQGSEMSELFREMGIDPSSPEVVAARDDARDASCLVGTLVGARQDAGLSQRDVAARMGTTQSAVSDIERTASDHRLSTLQRYARAVGARVQIRVSITSVQTGWRDEGRITVRASGSQTVSTQKHSWESTRIRASGVLETA